jgi:diacylglycerol kinase (ATP)
MLAALKYRFIYNPFSGHNARSPRTLRRTLDFIATHRLDATLVVTAHPGHATHLAHQAVAEGCTVIVAVGGDGTMNEIAQALVGTSAALGLIPCGSGNGLGRCLGIVGRGRDPFDVLRDGQPRLIDSGIAAGHPFFNVMGLGFDADISARFARLPRRGFQAYVKTTLSAWRDFVPVKVNIRSAESALASEALMVAVANSNQYGNDCYIAPGAQVDDGRLDLTVVKPVSFWQALPLARRLFAGNLDGCPHVHRLRSSRFTIERPAPGLIHTDGEPHEAGATIEVSVKPQSLRILAPKA